MSGSLSSWCLHRCLLFERFVFLSGTSILLWKFYEMSLTIYIVLVVKCHWLSIYLHCGCSWILLLKQKWVTCMRLSVWICPPGELSLFVETYGELTTPFWFLCLLSLCMRCSTCGCSYNELCLLLFLFVHSLPTPISNLPWSISTWFCSTNNWMIWEVLKWNHDSISAKLNLW